MAEHVRLVASYLGIVSLLCQVTLLVMQLRTYRRTGHSSLLILAIASASAVLYLGCGFATALYISREDILWRLSLGMEILFVAQAVLAIWGAASLFRAFAARYTRPEHDISATPAQGLAGANERLQTDLIQTMPKRRRASTLASLFRLWTLCGVHDVAALATERSVALLAVLSLALWMSIDRLRSGPGSTFEAFGIPELGLIVLMLLVLGFAMARPSRPPVSYRQSLFIITAVLPVLIALDTLIDDHLPDRWVPAAGIALLVYALIYIWRALRSFSGAPQPWSVLLSAALLCGYVGMDRAIYLSPSLWVHTDPERTVDLTWKAAVSEPLLFDQQRRIDRALSNVMTGDGASASVFFVGFAGVASQKVFAEEIKLAGRVVASRYDTAQRQLLLINDRRDREAYPLATVSGLRYALSGIARKMNLQRDILFLSLSSHGSAAPALSVSNGALSLEQVTGENLAQALREAGIRWRIIVISACHAGAFIPALQDPSTIVITAAAADRTSFGCSDDRDLTYFGEAFYRDALPKAHNLEEAFALAKTAIAEREAAEHMTPSQPQAYFGADIDRSLPRH